MVPGENKPRLFQGATVPGECKEDPQGKGGAAPWTASSTSQSVACPVLYLLEDAHSPAIAVGRLNRLTQKLHKLSLDFPSSSCPGCMCTSSKWLNALDSCQVCVGTLAVSSKAGGQPGEQRVSSLSPVKMVVQGISWAASTADLAMSQNTEQEPGDTSHSGWGWAGGRKGAKWEAHCVQRWSLRNELLVATTNSQLPQQDRNCLPPLREVAFLKQGLLVL